MCHSKWGGCVWSGIMNVLLVIGGINWGLIGLGGLFNASSSWNVVGMILGSVPKIEAIVYVLVGVAALMKLIGCKCKKCKEACANCVCSADGKTESGM